MSGIFNIICKDVDGNNINIVPQIQQDEEKITLIAAIESGLIYVGPDGGNTIKIQRQKKLIDPIPRVYYGRKDIVSYKDENNIKNETLRIAKEYYGKDVEKKLVIVYNFECIVIIQCLRNGTK